MAAAPIQRLYTGLDAVKANRILFQKMDRKDQWPYIHCYPPPDSITVHEIGSAVAGNQGATQTVLTYLVPSGFRFIFQGIIQVFTGGTFIPGDALWSVTVNANTVTDIQASPVHGLNNVPIPLGSISPSWSIDWFARAYEFASLDVLRFGVTNVNITPGSPNVFTAAAFGYLVPDVKTK